jgi:hypothetical protein
MEEKALEGRTPKRARFDGRFRFPEVPVRRSPPRFMVQRLTPLELWINL